MQFTVNKESIIHSLGMVCGIVSRRPTLPILSHVLLSAQDNALNMTTTDTELQMVADAEIKTEKAGRIAVPARKIFEICRALPDDATVTFTLKDDKAHLKSGKSRFSLSTLPADDFPDAEQQDYDDEISIAQSSLKSLLDETSFAMGKDDVRYYLNGLLLVHDGNELTAVATDGHRLALGKIKTASGATQKTSIIVPRKAILELGRLLHDSDENLTLKLGKKGIQATLKGVQLTSRLIDGQFPDYERVIPLNGDKTMIAECDLLRQSLSRAAILVSDNTPGVRLNFDNGTLKATTVNSEQEQAEIDIDIEYDGAPLEIAFNNAYLLDCLNVIPDDRVKMMFTDSSGSALITPANENIHRQYVVMPMRL